MTRRLSTQQARPRLAALGLTLSTALGLSSCETQRLVIETEPAEAAVFLNGIENPAALMWREDEEPEDEDGPQTEAEIGAELTRTTPLPADSPLRETGDEDAAATSSGEEPDTAGSNASDGAPGALAIGPEGVPEDGTSATLEPSTSGDTQLSILDPEAAARQAEALEAYTPPPKPLREGVMVPYFGAFSVTTVPDEPADRVPEFEPTRVIHHVAPPVSGWLFPADFFIELTLAATDSLDEQIRIVAPAKPLSHPVTDGVTPPDLGLLRARAAQISVDR